MSKHGTSAAYTRHLRDGSSPCAACRRAKAAYQQGWRTGRGRASHLRLARARRWALVRLAQQRPQEYQALYAQALAELDAEAESA